MIPNGRNSGLYHENGFLTSGHKRGEWRGKKREETRGEIGEVGKERREIDARTYEEPSYITRQRCLVLNDWALDMFRREEYGKVR